MRGHHHLGLLDVDGTLVNDAWEHWLSADVHYCFIIDEYTL